MLPWREDPAEEWEVPALTTAHASREAAARALATLPAAWMRRPGERRIESVYTEPAFAEALAERDTRALWPRIRGVWARSLPFLAIVAFAALGNHRDPLAFVILGLLVLANAVSSAEILGQGRHLRRDWDGYARSQDQALRAALWISARPTLGRLAGLLAIAIALVGLVAAAGGTRTILSLAVDSGRIREGAWWLLFTGPLLHGSLMHGIFNLMAWHWLANWTAQLLGRAQVLPVFVASMVVGALVTTVLDKHPSVGISGGIMGILGLLFIAALRWHRNAPPGLVRAIGITLALMGALTLTAREGIDHGAPLGGLVTGLAFGTMSVPTKPGPLAHGGGWAFLHGVALLILVASLATTLVLVLGV